MADQFDKHQPGLESPGIHAAAVTPHDSTNFTNTSRAIWVGGAGNVVAVMLGGETVTFTSVPAGTLLPIRATRVNNTNTTASAMVNIW